MKVRDIMRSEVRVTTPTADLTRVGTMMMEAGCGVVPVLDGDDEVVGMITDRDICLALTRWDTRPSQLTVSEVMSRTVYSCMAVDDVLDALQVMRNHRVRRLPVVDRRNHIEGILSLDDIVLYARGALAQQHEGFAGPFYADVALTLKAICTNPVPAMA